MRLAQIELSKIEPNPDNPRGIDIATEDKELGALKDSIKQFGVMVPIVVTPKGNNFFLIDGERRYHAARSVGLPKIPAYIIEKSGDGEEFTSGELLYRMFQIHHLREQWKAIQQCRALEPIYKEIASSKSLRELPNERSRLKAAVDMLVSETGIDERTAADRVKFLRFPSDIRKKLYKDPNGPGHAYALEIEDKIVIPAMTNYPEYFAETAPDTVRRDLFKKTATVPENRDEIRHLAPYLRTSFTQPADRAKFLKVFRSIHSDESVTFRDAEEIFRREFPQLLHKDPPSPRRLVTLMAELTKAIEDFDVSSLPAAKRRAKAGAGELLVSAKDLQAATKRFIEELGGVSA